MIISIDIIQIDILMLGVVQLLLLSSLMLCFDGQSPILEMPLSTKDHFIASFFNIGSKNTKVQLDISSQQLQICCKRTDTIFQKVYYFITNPFLQDQDYSCQPSNPNNSYVDEAEFSKLGLIQITFQQISYPQCNFGILGMNKKSTLLALLPIDQQFYVISKELKLTESINSWILQVGGSDDANSFSNFPAGDSSSWEFQVQSIQFNGMTLQANSVLLTTISSKMQIPSQSYSVIEQQLLNNYKCIKNGDEILCPCETGIPQSYPIFSFTLPNKNGSKDDVKLQILPISYLEENDEVCRSIISESQTSSPSWVLNLLLFEKTNLKFDHVHNLIGFSPQVNNLENNDVIKLPIQLILNCAVILLMCIFIAMILIELIKRISGLEEAKNETFQTYMIRRQE